MNFLIGMNGLGVVSIIIGGAVLGFSVLAAFGAGLGMILNGQIRREQEERESEAVAEAIMRRQYQAKPPPRPIGHVRPMSHARRLELDLDTMTIDDIRRAIDSFSEPGVPAPMPAMPIRLGDGEAHP
jgi:hypothetical protein